MFSDIRISFPASFNATTLEVMPLSEKGREWFQSKFGRGAVSAEIYKSSGPDFEDAVIAAGLRHEVIHR